MIWKVLEVFRVIRTFARFTSINLVDPTGSEEKVRSLYDPTFVCIIGFVKLESSSVPGLLHVCAPPKMHIYIYMLALPGPTFYVFDQMWTM